MFDLKYIRAHPDRIREAIRAKRENADLDRILALDAQRRAHLVEVEQLKAERNRASQEIGQRKAAGEDAAAAIAEMKQVSERIKALDARVREVDEQLGCLLAWVPNVPHPSVPEGDESANQLVRRWGEVREGEELRDHLTLGEELGILDFGAASRLSGHGWATFVGLGARLQRALIDFMIDRHVAAGYREVRIPYAVREESLFGCGQLPKLREDMYAITDEDLFLIPTAEVPLTNFYREEELQLEDLPLQLVAYSPCWRREAGSYGKETRGLMRLHQFDKVEMVKLVTPESSYDELESLTRDAEGVLQALELPYRVMLLATGDLSFAAAKCYDIELWAPGEGRWLEVSSCSNFEAFQARRCNLRYRDEARKLRHVHSLNGSGVALPRLTIALLEHHQTRSGSVRIPEPLRPYLGGIAELTPAAEG
ncbi:MAG: serine--tRNA ligase [Candidatus Eisenbacteria bacterium]|nr:serine--tRNA ligase [Candidatus Eisenbacteria bacterium]